MDSDHTGQACCLYYWVLCVWAVNTMMCGCNGSEIGQFLSSPRAPPPKNNSHKAAGADGEKVINSLAVMEAEIGLFLSSPRTCFKPGWIVSTYKEGVGRSQAQVCTLYHFKETIWLLLGLNLIAYRKAADAKVKLTFKRVVDSSCTEGSWWWLPCVLVTDDSSFLSEPQHKLWHWFPFTSAL